MGTIRKPIDKELLIKYKNEGRTNKELTLIFNIGEGLLGRYIKSLINEGKIVLPKKKSWNSELKTNSQTVICSNCKNETTKPSSYFKSHKGENFYCSKKCELQYYQDNLYETRKCPICQKEFKASKKNTQIFCSEDCKNKNFSKIGLEAIKEKYTSEKRSESLKLMWASRKEDILKKRNTVEYKDKIGETTKERFEKDIDFKEKHRMSCLESMTKERKEVLKKRAIERIEKNNKTITRPNLIVADLLLSLNIPYKMEYPIDNICRTDIKILNKDIIIEIFGDYWHCNPLFFNENFIKTYSQKGNIERDREKEKLLKERYPNFKIIRLWESDVYFNLEKCKNIILNENNNDYVLIELDRCYIKEIDLKQANIFCYKYHYLKKAPIVINKAYGFFFNESLIGISVFRHPNTNYSTSELIPGKYLELSRFCLVDCLPKNAASYFLSRSMKKIKEDYSDLKGIISYSDNSIHSGTIYHATNWTEIGEVSGNYYYINEYDQEIDRRKVYNHCKALGIKETEYVQKLGLQKIETSSKTKFVYYYKS